jgi:hypothetical protein
MTDPDPATTPPPTPAATSGTGPAPQSQADIDDDDLPDGDPRKKKKPTGFAGLSSAQQMILSIFMLLFGNFLTAEDSEAAQGRDPQQDPVLQNLNKLFAGALGMDPAGQPYNDLKHNMRTPGYDWHNDKPLVTHLHNSGALDPNGGITSFVKNPPKSLLDLIASHESGGNYNSAYEGSKIKPPKPLTEMTVQQVMDWQNQSVHAGSASSAAGRYQIIGGTLRGLVKDMGIDPNTTKFDQATQDKMATVLMQRRGLDKFMKGEMSQADFMKNLALEWASLPKDNSGRAAYGGVATNPTMALVSPSVVNTVLANEKKQYLAGVSASGNALAANATPASLRPPFKTATSGTGASVTVASNNTPADPKKTPSLNS